MLETLLLVTQLTAPPSPAVQWDYLDADPGDQFLVCLDSQPTSACSKVLRTTGVAGATSPDGPLHTFTFKLPTLAFGDHRVAVQTCDATANNCSPGVTLTFTVKAVMKNPLGLRLIGGAAGQ